MGCRDGGRGEGWLEMEEGGGVEPAEGQQTTINVHIVNSEETTDICSILVLLNYTQLCIVVH